MEEANKFNEWMKKIHNLHFADTKRMVLAYEKFTKNKEEKNEDNKRQLRLEVSN